MSDLIPDWDTPLSAHPELPEPKTLLPVVVSPNAGTGSLGCSSCWLEADGDCFAVAALGGSRDWVRPHLRDNTRPDWCPLAKAPMTFAQVPF